MEIKQLHKQLLQNMEHYQFALRVLQLCNEAKVEKLTVVLGHVFHPFALLVGVGMGGFVDEFIFVFLRNQFFVPQSSFPIPNSTLSIAHYWSGFSLKP